MTSKDPNYGIFIRNDLIHTAPALRNNQRTILLGQVVRIEETIGADKYRIRILQDDYSWDNTNFYCEKKKIALIPEKLHLFIAAIASPQERVKLSKDKELCEKLKHLSLNDCVGFTAIQDILLATIRYIGIVKGMGHCYGIELHDRKKNNNCNGTYSGTQYFTCKPGHGVFTTIQNLKPMASYPLSSRKSPSPLQEMDIFCEGKPKYEEIVTKYQEYQEFPKKTPLKSSNYARQSVSLQNISDMGSASSTINTNNDFDQNTIIQPDKTYLMHEKSRNKSEVDLIEVIGGSWSGTTENKDLESYTDLKKNFDKNENYRDRNGQEPRRTRNKSMNVLSHIFNDNSTTRKSKFYTSELPVESYKQHKKEEHSKKLNEKSEQLQTNARASSTFYVNDKPKYQDPLPGTTNDLTIGTLVEVQNDVSEHPLYGVVRWMGVETGTNHILVGVELEEECLHLPLTLTNGTYYSERYFECGPDRGLFVPLQQCHKDSRFQDGTPTPVRHATEKIFDCPVIPGAVAPLCMPTEEDVEAVCGKGRGIQGHHNSCYLDVTLFSMFTYTAVFDSVLFRPKNQNDINDYEEVQRVLREEIVNPLRKNLYVSADHVMKLRKLLDRLSSVSGLTCEEKDPEEFLNSLLAQILKAEPFLKLSSGQEAFHYQLFVEKDADLSLPTVQQLFEQSFLTSNIKLKEVPSCLIIQMPRFGKNFKMYPRILPSQLLDVTDVIEGSPRQCMVCGKLARWECLKCFDGYNNAGLESTAFCLQCLQITHRHEQRSHHRAKELEVAPDFLIMEDHCRPPRLFMELFAVICIETSHYVAFVKCGVGHEAPWCFFDSMADRLGEKNGFNIPEMVACPDVSQWLSDDRICKQLHEEYQSDRCLPEHARRLLCDAYICMYQSSDVMMYR